MVSSRVSVFVPAGQSAPYLDNQLGKNTECLSGRRDFGPSGGIFSVTIGIASRSLLGLLPGVYQSQLLGAADVYRELAFAFSLVLTVVGVFFLSVYADIVILRRNKG